MQKIALSFAAGLLALAAAGADAQTFWKWRDASGQLHIGDTPPPPGTPAKNILSGVLPAPAPVASAASVPAGDSALERKKKAADKEKADQLAADRAAADAKIAAARKDNCTRAQAALAPLKDGQRVARVNDKGEREVLDDAGRAAEIQRVQDAIASNCGAAPAAQ